MKKQIAAIAAASALAITAFAGTADAQGKPGDKNIVEIASSVNAETGEYSALLAAAQCDYFEGAIVAALTSDDKVTLFAPTDAAFAALGLTAGNVCETFDGSEDALADPATLATVLTYHVTEGRRFSNSVVPKGNQPKTIDTLAGLPIQVNDDLTITDVEDAYEPMIVDLFDVNASNGVIHTIDGVLLPIDIIPAD